MVAPEATAVFWAIWVKMPLANGRPKKVTVSGSLSGSDTPTLEGRRGADPGGGVGRGVEGRRRRRGVAGRRRDEAGDPGGAGPPTIVPLAAAGDVMESADGRAGRFVETPARDEAGARGELGVLGGRIWACVRATFQTRASSITPWKRPTDRCRSEVIMAPRATRWIESERGCTPGVLLASRLPSR